MASVFLDFITISISTSPVIVVLILFSPFLNQRYASKWNYWIWVFLAFRLIIPFHGTNDHLIGSPLPQLKSAELIDKQNGSHRPVEQAALSGQIVVEIPPQMTTPILRQSQETNIPITLLDLMTFVWLFNSLLFLSVHLFSYIAYKRQVVNKGIYIRDARILSQINELKQELRIKSAIPVIKFPEAHSPMIIGFLKPILILPQEQYPSEELFFILKHELVHCKRKDVSIKLLFLAAHAIHWFNPLIWMMQKEAAIAMELSCDECVIQGADYNVRKAYTETLLSTLHKHGGKRSALSTQFHGGTQIMKKRFKNILNKTGKKNGVAVLLCAAVLAIGSGMLVGCSITDESTKKTPDAMENKRISEATQTENKDQNIDQNIDQDNNQNIDQNNNRYNDQDNNQKNDQGTDKEPENSLPNDEISAAEIPQDGQIYGYLSDFDNISVTIDRQLWVTSESEDWKPEYNEDAGFQVVDAKGADIVYPLFEDCAFSVLENHQNPVVALDKKAFEKYLSKMDYPVLWMIQLQDGQIKDIREQYVP